MRELEQCIRRVLLTGSCSADPASLAGLDDDSILARARAGGLDATAIVATYCQALYDELKSYEKVAGLLELDRRTVKKYIQGLGTVPR